MRILFVGDIVGEKALEYLENNLEQIKKDNRINIVIVNGENITNGRGLNKDHYQRLMRLGIFAVTMGNHTFSQRQIREILPNSKIIIPANFNTELGKGFLEIKYNDKTITIINLLGRVYMNNMCLEDPFSTLDKILDKVNSDYIIVDMHAEATSEKIALGLDFDGRVSAIVGTHTHVPTSDAKVLPKGTLYQSDVGMVGPKYSVLGDDTQTIINRFRTGVFEPAKVMDNPIEFNAVILDFNPIKNTITPLHLEEN